MDTSAAVTHSEHFQTLLEAGLPQKVAEKLDEIYIAGKAQWIYLHIEICNFQCLSVYFYFIFFCMYCHYYHLFEWGDRLPKQLFVVSYQNGYCSATKWLNYTFPVWKCDKHLSICIPNTIDWCQGEWKKKKQQQKKTVLILMSWRPNAVSILPYKFELSSLSDETGYHAAICRDTPGGHCTIYFLRSQSSALVFLTWPETMAAAVWCAAGCLGQGMAPSTEEDPDQLIMKSQSPCRKGGAGISSCTVTSVVISSAEKRAGWRPKRCLWLQLD